MRYLKVLLRSRGAGTGERVREGGRKGKSLMWKSEGNFRNLHRSGEKWVNSRTKIDVTRKVITINSHPVFFLSFVCIVFCLFTEYFRGELKYCNFFLASPPPSLFLFSFLLFHFFDKKMNESYNKELFKNLQELSFSKK